MVKAMWRSLRQQGASAKALTSKPTKRSNLLTERLGAYARRCMLNLLTEPKGHGAMYRLEWRLLGLPTALISAHEATLRHALALVERGACNLAACTRGERTADDSCSSLTLFAKQYPRFDANRLAGPHGSQCACGLRTTHSTCMCRQPVSQSYMHVQT